MLAEICLGIAIISSYILIFILGKKYKEKKIVKFISIVFVELIIWCSGVLIQKLFADAYSENLIYFDYITYIGACMVFPTALYVSYSFKNGEKKAPKWYLLFYIIPCICLFLLWTNDYHHLFYKVYSTNFAETEYGIIFYINTIYTYALALVFIVQMIRASILNSGFLSKQTVILILGSLIPLIVNVLGTTKIINISIYVTPILFVVTLMCYALAIFKYKVFNITPIALSTIIDTMTDSFIVISLDGTVVDTNREFRESFNKYVDVKEKVNLYEILKESKINDLIKLEEKIRECIKEDSTKVCEINIFNQSSDEIINEDLEKAFEVKISLVKNKGKIKRNVGVLLLFNDITQHKKDMKELEEKQEIIAKQAQLVSIGELAGGVAHDINTPISAIRTGITMLRASNPERPEAEMQIIETMDNCSNKILNIVNSMRNQIRNLGGNTDTVFKISTVINDIKCITYHEVRKYKAEVEVEIEDDLSIKGDPAKLGQVLTNIVMNAAQAYKDTDGGKIKIILMRGPQNMAITKIIDFAGGIDDSVKDKIFNSMLTTKGVEGTGLGLYLAYSVIKGNFNGEINFDTEKGEGTTFYISIPIYIEEKKDD